MSEDQQNKEITEDLYEDEDEVPLITSRTGRTLSIHQPLPSSFPTRPGGKSARSILRGESSVIELSYNKSHNQFVGIRDDSLGSSSEHKHGPSTKIHSQNYIEDESEVWKAHKILEHHLHRGKFWNTGKHETVTRYIIIASIGIIQAIVAYTTNIISAIFIENKYETANDILSLYAESDSKAFVLIRAFLSFYIRQTFYASVAAFFVFIAPASAGSGIPEVKCFLNGIDLPNVTSLKTGISKVLGVICSVSAGLPVGKEGPMVHSGAVVATAISGHRIRDDKAKRDYIACGAAAGVCTAFSAPIGGILFALEEGASFWAPSLTWRTFFCTMCALWTLYILNTIGGEFGKVGFDRLFSFGNFIYEGEASSFAVFELFLFALIGIMGGLIGACFNAANEKLTHWRIKHVNHSKVRRLVEVLIISSIVTVVSFILPIIWGKCDPLPSADSLPQSNRALIENLVPFGCVKGEEYNQVASLVFTDANVAIRLLFHLHARSFDPAALLLFFIPYISLGSIVYGIAIPSGLFVPSLLAGAAFGRLFGNLVYILYPEGRLAFSNTYSLIGAASVLGGMARMTISLTVILLECTGNEQFVLPLMISLMFARLTGNLFNDDLYHIHIHLKNGVHFLENELHSITRHHNLVAGQIMGKHVVFFRPVEKVGVVYDLLKAYPYSNFPVIDTGDGDILYGTIGRNQLCILLRRRAFGHPSQPADDSFCSTESSHHGTRIISNFIEVQPYGQRFMPLIQGEVTQKAYPRYPQIQEIRISRDDRECFVDLRPYAHTAPYTVQETCSVERTYNLFRTLGARFLVVVNKYNQCVGTITRKDLTPESLALHMLTKGKHE